MHDILDLSHKRYLLFMRMIVCYTAVFSVVTQRSLALRDDTKNGCVADYENEGPLLSQIKQALLFEIKSTCQIRSWHRLQNSPPFCVFKYLRTIKQKVWSEGENGERDWRKTLFFSRLTRLTGA